MIRGGLRLPILTASPNGRPSLELNPSLTWIARLGLRDGPEVVQAVGVEGGVKTPEPWRRDRRPDAGEAWRSVLARSVRHVLTLDPPPPAVSAECGGLAISQRGAALTTRPPPFRAQVSRKAGVAGSGCFQHG